ncbi:MAG: FAD:protein FMN transferase [Planctomycetota bacterium]
MKNVALFMILMLAAGLVTLVLIRSEPATPTAFNGSTMGTTYTVRLAREMPGEQQKIWQARVQKCLDDINARMSTYQSDSEVSRFNRSASTDWFPVSRQTALVVQTALQVSEQTRGAFDVTVDPLVNLWNFGPERRPLGIPTDAEIEAARATVGYQHLSVRVAPPALRKAFPKLTIDLSGIAKGFAVDRIGRLLEQGGIGPYMVEVGGEVRTRGTKNNGAPWRIGIEQPVSGQRLLEGVLELEDIALATSGDYRNFFEWNGQLYSHAIDPRAGGPVTHGVAAVSVLAPTAMRADAYATGLMVLPPEEAWGVAKDLGLEIMVVIRGREGCRRRATPGFSSRMQEVKRGAR